MHRHPFRAARLAAAVALAAACGASLTAQVGVSAEVQAARYPRARAANTVQADQSDIRGWASLDFEAGRDSRIGVRGDLVVYAPDRLPALVDGEARLVWRTRRWELAGGLLRESWGRLPRSEIDMLGAENTPFSLVVPEQRLSQPAVRSSLLLPGVSIDTYVLFGLRDRPVPSSGSRMNFGLPTRNVARRGELGDQAVAVRLSGTTKAVDWGAHVFKGLNRRPTFVPRVSSAGIGGVDALYTDVLQIGGDTEAILGDWRLMAEGYRRSGAVDIAGRERIMGYVAAAAEYQRFGVFGGRLDVFPRVQFTTDTRGERADLPFASSMRAGVRVAKMSPRHVQVEAGYVYDWHLRGHGVSGSAETRLFEGPTLLIGARVTRFSQGSTPTVLDVWARDLELLGYVRLEISQ